MNPYLKRFFDFFGGRSFAFAVIAFVIGTVLAWFGKLTFEYVGLIGAIQGLVTYRAIRADNIGAPPNNGRDDG